MTKKLGVGIIGTGQRGASYVHEIARSDQATITCLCDIDQHRLESFAQDKLSHPVTLTTSLSDMLKREDTDAIIITTPDPSHKEIALQALNAGKHIVLEKPMALTPEDCKEILQAREKSGKIMQIGFVLRCTNFYRKIKEIIDSGSLGQIMSISAGEYLGVDHSASYMRRWHRKSKNSGSFLLAKCSHDLDILNWLTGSLPTHVASFGSNDFFLPSKQPATHCSKCPQADTCSFKFQGGFVYMTKTDIANPSKRDFDLCVYNNDKDIVDNQVSILQFANGMRATFTLQLFRSRGDRTITICGSDGYITANMSEKTIRVEYAKDHTVKEHQLEMVKDSNHGGGDQRFVAEFLEAIREGRELPVDLMAGLASTVVGTAIERARLTCQVVTIDPASYQM